LAGLAGGDGRRKRVDGSRAYDKGRFRRRVKELPVGTRRSGVDAPGLGPARVGIPRGTVDLDGAFSDGTRGGSWGLVTANSSLTSTVFGVPVLWVVLHGALEAGAHVLVSKLETSLQACIQSAELSGELRVDGDIGGAQVAWVSFTLRSESGVRCGTKTSSCRRGFGRRCCKVALFLSGLKVAVLRDRVVRGLRIVKNGGDVGRRNVTAVAGKVKIGVRTTVVVERTGRKDRRSLCKRGGSKSGLKFILRVGGERALKASGNVDGRRVTVG